MLRLAALSFALVASSSLSLVVLACTPSSSTDAGASTGEGEGEGEGDVLPTAIVPDIVDAVRACTFVEECLDPEAGGTGVAPAATISLCVFGYMDLAYKGGYAAYVPRYDLFSACAAVADDCVDFRACLADFGRISVCPGGDTARTCDGEIVRGACSQSIGWGNGMNCGEIGLTCEDNGFAQCVAPACMGTSTQTCLPDDTGMSVCLFNTGGAKSCAGTTCVDLSVDAGPAAQCFPGETSTCTTSGIVCDGDVSVACQAPGEARVDCTLAARHCNPSTGACENDASDCNEYYTDSCNNDVLTVCANGGLVTQDCAALGATCGDTHFAGHKGCVW